MRQPLTGARRPIPIAVLAMLLAIGSLPAMSTPVAGASLPATKTVSTAASDWVGTGVSPAAGTRLKLTATGDGTYCGPGCVAPTPAGDTSNTWACGGGYSGLGGVPCIALIGSWSGGPAFVIGKGATITAPGGKELRLGIHDWKFDDNTGSYRVKIDEVKPKLTIDWTMPARLTPETPDKEAWHLLDGLPGIREVNPTTWKASVFLREKSARYSCPSGTRYAWQVKPLDGGRVLQRPPAGCDLKLSVSELGRYAVTATRETLKGGQWRRDEDPTTKKTVLLKDWLIVGLGDSNGSGEGNSSSFFYKRCNRGTASYQFQTALYVEKQDPRTSVTFIFASCSGARIEHLVDTPYTGTRPANPPLAPQIEQASFLLSRGSPRRTVDAALVSVGVNDLAFGPLMTFCVKHAKQTLLLPGTPCPDKGALVQLGPGGRVSGFEPSATRPAMRTHLQRLLQQLPDRYPELARALKARIGASGGLGLSADRVFITRYPDFMHGADGDYCDTRDANLYFQANWDRSTWTWLSLAGAQLNQRVGAAAARFGWRAVAPAAIGARGWCNLASSLFLGIGEAILRWNVDGPFHPIAEAHLMARDAHTPLVCRRLYKTDDCTGQPR